MQIDLAHNPLPPNGNLIPCSDSTVTWIPASQAQLYHRQRMVHDMRIPPIVCSRESVSASLHIIFIFFQFFFIVLEKLFSAFTLALSFCVILKKFKVGSDWEFKNKKKSTLKVIHF